MEYHKIATLFERDKKTFKVTSQLKKPVYGQIKEWDFTEKIDGTNIRCIWKDKKISFGGRTDNAQIPATLFQWLTDNITPEKMESIFPDVDIVLYGEGYGGNIQSGQDYSETQKFILFDVMANEKWWLDWDNTCDVASKLKLEAVPFIGSMSLEDGIEMVRQGFKSKLGNRTKDAEGLIGRTREPLFDKKGSRLIIKLKTRDF